MMMRRTCVCSFWVVATMLSGSATAEPIQYQSQSRTLEAEASIFPGGMSDSGADQAPDFGPWGTTVEAEVLMDNVFAHGDASHDSILLDDRIVADGSSNAVHSYVASLPDTAAANATSAMEIGFSIEQDQAYSIEGFVELLGFPDPAEEPTSVAVRLLDDGGGEVFAWELDGGAGLIPFATGGVLPAGQYTLEAASTTFSTGADPASVSRGAYSFELVVPEPMTAALLLAAVPMLPHRRSA